MKVKYIMIIAILLLCNRILGQKIDRALTVGDNLPNFLIPKVINIKNKVLNTKDYINGLLIIDFWGTGCRSCIEAMPEMEKLQKKMGTKVKILPVAREKETYILDFWKHNKYTKNLKEPSVVEDKLFNLYFPHKTIPHEVWIYKGKIIAITELEYVDEHNILRILNGENVDWPLKNDFYKYDLSKPIFILNESKSNINRSGIQYSAISDYKEKVSSGGFSGGEGIIRDTSNKTIRRYFLNQPILTSYYSEWCNLKKPSTLIKPHIDFQANQVIWEVVDKSKYFFERKQNLYSADWIMKNAICFESVYQDIGQNDQEIHQSVISDMNRLLGLYVRWEKRIEKVLVVRKDMKSVFHAKFSSSFQKYKVSNLVYELNNIAKNPYIFNESNDEETDVLIDSKFISDISYVRLALQNCGFNFVEEEREVDKLIFTETNNGRIIDSEMQTSAVKLR